MSKGKIIVTGPVNGSAQDCFQALEASELQVDSLPLDALPTVATHPDILAIITALDETNTSAVESVLKTVRLQNEGLPFFVVGPGQDVRVVSKLMRQGATEFFPQNFDTQELLKTLTEHIERYNLLQKIFYAPDINLVDARFEGMIGRNPKMQENFKIIAAVAKSNATVLVLGESGTGKELVAKALHHLSERKNKRFVDLNCGAIPHELLENELFGHEKGAFTGAHRRYLGSFEAADGGTLFLDEISEMDPLLQVKLLRVLQERSFNRIGGTERIDVDVRVVAATNRDLLGRIKEGLFREDLYYRLNVISIYLPPLRERREDIAILAQLFLELAASKNGRIFVDFLPETMEALINYDWPGNVRELENTIERVVVLHDDTRVQPKHLPDYIQKVDRRIPLHEGLIGSDTSGIMILPLADLERRAIQQALAFYHGNISVAAKKLNIGQATLYRKIKRYGLER